MKYCNDCKMSVSTDTEYCPLCGDMLKVIDNSPCVNFPRVKKHVVGSKIKILNTVFFAMSILGSFICIVVNMATFSLAPVKWSVVASIGIFYCWHLISRCILKKGNATKVLCRQLVTVSILLLVIDVFLTDFQGWSVAYAIPLLSLSISISILIIALASMLYYRDHLHYSLTAAGLGSMQIFLLFSAIPKWAIIASASTSICVLILLAIISKKSVEGELKKRLHI